MPDFDLNIESNVREISALFDEVGGKILIEARVAATNKTMSAARTQIRKEVSSKTGVPSKILSRRLRLKRAKKKIPTANLFIGTYPVPAIQLGAKEAKRGVTFRGVSGRVKRPSAFIETMKSGHRGVFERESSDSLPINQVLVRITSAARNAANRQVNTVMPANMQKIYAREFNFRTGKAISRRRLKARV